MKIRHRRLFPFALLAVAAALPGTARAQTAAYTITDLGTLVGTTSQGYGINDQGQIVGIASVNATVSNSTY